MYSSMDLQAMFTGVVSKYIQNSSLKVFEEVLAFFNFFIFLKISIFTASQKQRCLVSLEG